MADRDRDPDPDPDPDEDWLLARERGDDVSHVSPRSRARYEQLDQLIAALPERPPPAGWKQRVLDTLDAPSPRGSSDALQLPPATPANAPLGPPPPRSSSDQLEAPPAIAATTADRPPPRSPPATRTDADGRSTGGRRTPIVRGWRAWILAAAGIVVGMLVLQLFIPRPKQAPTEPVVTIETRRGESPHRGDDVAVGDTLVVHARSDQPIELRIYGDGGESLARCTDSQGCTVERNGRLRDYTVDVPLRSPGAVRAVLFTGGTMPEPSKDLDADLEAAQAAHITARPVGTVHVE
jgi:hypothetical protein